MEILIRALLDDQKNIQDKLQEAQSTINRINILESEIKQDRENIEKEKGYILSESRRLLNEDTRIKAQWKALENTKNYIK
jgi:predicted nuclease with TOPRIM domain